MSKGFRKGAVSTQFLLLSAAWALVAVSLLFLTTELKQVEQENGVKIAALMTANRVAAFVDGFRKDACYDAACEARLRLPSTLKGPGFAGEVNYSLAITGNKVVVSAQGYGNMTTYMSTGAGGLRVAISEENATKTITLNG